MVAILLLVGGFVLSLLSTWIMLLGAARLDANTYGVLIDRAVNYQVRENKRPSACLTA